MNTCKIPTWEEHKQPKKDLLDKYTNMKEEEYKKEFFGVFESALDEGVEVCKVDKNGNIKHIPNSKTFKKA